MRYVVASISSAWPMLGVEIIMEHSRTISTVCGSLLSCGMIFADLKF